MSLFEICQSLYVVAALPESRMESEWEEERILSANVLNMNFSVGVSMYRENVT
jgi:hypothetical protein